MGINTLKQSSLEELNSTIKKLITPGKGLLAADESTGHYCQTFCRN